MKYGRKTEWREKFARARKRLLVVVRIMSFVKRERKLSLLKGAKNKHV